MAAAGDRRGELSGDPTPCWAGGNASVVALVAGVMAAPMPTPSTNRNVAGQRFLSPKTVEYHLRKVFLKLGVSSCAELANLPLAPVAVGAAELTPAPYSPVWPSISAPGALFFTDSIPFRADCLRS